MKNYLSITFLKLSIGAFLFSSPILYSQDEPDFVDLGIRFVSEPPAQVKINQLFGVQAEVYLDSNTSSVPAGETVKAEVSLVDPSGIIIQTHSQEWNGFNEDTNGVITNQEGQLLLQVPWSQANKWTEGATWTIILRLTATSVESDMTDNIAQRSFGLLLPDLDLSVNSVTATDPLTGAPTTSFIPNTNYSVSGSVSNIGQVMTQPSIHTSVVARLRQLFPVGAGQYDLGGVIDEQAIVFPGNNGATLYLPPNGSWEFTIDNLFLPADAVGTYAIEVEVNPSDIPGGRIMVEQSYTNNKVVHPALAIDADEDGITDYYTGAVININPSEGNETSFAKLEFVENSYKGESGSFRGLDPAFISFAIRNNGTRPVSSGDDISSKILLSKDLQADENDFIIRQFNLGGSGIGLGMLAGETINLTWFQQMPDNFEGDYYLLIEISNNGETKVFEMDSTPLISLVSENIGTTRKVRTEVVNGTLSERPSTSKSGRFVVYEKSVEEAGQVRQQIFLMDMQNPEAVPELISRAFTDGGGGNGNSFRPRISLDGSTVVFHSSATDLVPGDSNNKEDIFLYRVANRTILRAVNAQNEQLNGRSLYADVNGDGSKIVFESDATNADLDKEVSGSEIFLWELSPTGGGSIRALTNGNSSSYSPSIDDLGNRVVFDSFASDLLEMDGYDNGSASITDNDNNGFRDVYLIDLQTDTIFLASLNYLQSQATGGPSMNARISGDGSRIVFESKATNLVSEAGIAKVIVTEGGVGYAGRPTIEIVDDGFNSNGAPGSGAIISIDEDGINALTEIKKDAVLIINPGFGYVNPQVRIIPDPTYPEPIYEAKATAFLSSPEGDVFYVDVADLNGTTASNLEAPYYATRISQTTTNQTGGNFGSREPSISYDGNKIVYSTKSSNLLAESITRDDGKIFYNSTFQLPTAKAILVGPIYEIEILNSGFGYSSGFLNIEDLSGSGSGAQASYEVDQRGRIVSVEMIATGDNYQLEKTIISVAEPQGGSGFIAGNIRFKPTQGLGENRSGGGKIYKVEMNDYGLGYKIGDLEESSFADLIQFEGDGADLNGDGFPDGRLNPDRVNNVGGSLFLEQRFKVEILSGSSGFVGSDILNTTLTISDNNNSLEPLIIDFDTGAGSTATTIPITLGVTTKADARDAIIEMIDDYMVIASSGNVTQGPLIENNQPNGSSFTFAALSGRFSTNNPSAIKITEESNMLIMGSGYTTVTPVVNQVPSIYGFSEVKNNPDFILKDGEGRMTLLAQTDDQSDDIYLFDINEDLTTRISTSSFGTPAAYLSNNAFTIPSPPSNRFPSISGNGRYIFFSSDAYGLEGLSFLNSNQKPSDNIRTRSIFLRDLKTSVGDTPESSTIHLLYPTDESISYAPYNPIPLIARFEGLDMPSRVDVILNQQLIGSMNEFIAQPTALSGIEYNTGRYDFFMPQLSPGEYVFQLVAYGGSGQVLSTSPLTRLNISTFEGSIPPTVFLSNPSEYNQITSTSTIPFSVQAIDPDGSIEEIQFYINGVAYDEPLSLPQGLIDDKYIFSKLWSPQESGVFSVHATGVDSSGNLVSSQVYHITATTGNIGPRVNFLAPFSELELNASEVLQIIDGEIISLNLPDGAPVGENYYSAPKVLVSGSGEGAKITAVIGRNIKVPSEYGKITQFIITDGGSGYSAEKTTITIVPTIQTVVQGEEVFVSWDPERNNTNPSQILSAEFYIGEDLSGPQQGSGYVVAPRYYVNYPHEGRLRLEDPQPGATTSKVAIFSYQTEETEEASFPPLWYGGFAHAPVFFEINATSSSGNEIVEVGMMMDSVIVTKDNSPPYNVEWIPDDPGYYNLYCYAKDSFGNFTISEKLTILVEEMIGSNINAEFLSPQTDVFNTGSTLFLSVQATAENGIANVEFFFDQQSIGFGEKSSYSNAFSLSHELSGLPEGEYEISFVVRDLLGNQSGVFSSDFTTIPNRQSKVIRIVPKGDFLPFVLSPSTKTAEISAEWNGTAVNFTIEDGGRGYRFPPTIRLEGGGGTGLVAEPVLKNGVINYIEIKSSGSGYKDTIELKILEYANGQWLEHADSSRAVIEPIFDSIGGISAIYIVDGGHDYFPEAVPLMVEVDYNGTGSGSGFIAGPVHTYNGVVSNVLIKDSGEGYFTDPVVTVESGGHDYVEGEPVHIRVIADVGSGVDRVELRANGEVQPSRPPDDNQSKGYVEIVANDPYYDLFWVPDRDPEVGLGKVDGLGSWTFEVAIIDTKGNEQISEPFEVRVVNSKRPEIEILTPEEGAQFIFDPSGTITLVADAQDEDGVIDYVQFMVDNITTDINGSASYIVDLAPYILNWRPDRIGDFIVRAIAVDNGGVSSISKPVNIKVVDPVGFKPTATWEFPYEMKNRDPWAAYYLYYYGSSFGDAFIDEDFEVGSSVPLSVRASDDDGQIVDVEFFVDSESIGKVNQRYNGVYSAVWVPSSIGQSIVYAEVTDNDGNVVRTDVRNFNIGANLGKVPSIKLAYARKASGLKYDVQIQVTDILDPVGRWSYYIDENDDEVVGSFSVVLLVNGAPVGEIGVEALPYFSNYDVMQPVGDPEYSTTLSYDFTDITPLEFGTLSFSAVLMSRQGQRNYRQSYISNTIDIEISEEQFTQPEAPNLPPEGALLSPQTTQAAVAKSNIYESLISVDPNYGKLMSITMLEIGGGYNPDDLPEVKILGGGGSGARAIVDKDLLYGAIGDFSIIDGGSGYNNGDFITLDTNGSGSGFLAESYVVNGVLGASQTFSNGAILSKGENYRVNELVTIFDITTGNGARGYVSKIDDPDLTDQDDRGGVEEITIYSGGQDYNPGNTQFFIQSLEGTGFKTGDPLILNGVINSFKILENGSGYAYGDTFDFEVESTSGFGFLGSVSQDNVRDGALNITLVDPGENYTEEPIVVLSGGSYLPGVDGRKKPMQVTAGTKVTLLANANDFDGTIKSVKFYGNGQDLGVQTRKELIGITLTNGGSGYTAPPTVTIEGGGGTDSTAFAILEPAPQRPDGNRDNTAPRAVAAIYVAQRGNGFTSVPSVIIEGGQGFGAKAEAIIQDRAFVTDAKELVGGSGRWALEWVPTYPGSYSVSVEIIDDDGAVTYKESRAQLIVLPTSTSKVPEVFINTEYNGKSFTSQSKLRFIANAQDIDGKLEGVQFFANGEPLGEEIKSSYAADQLQQPYSVEFSPKEAGVFTIYAIARDNSGNYIMSETVTFTTTTGAGEAPNVRITEPTQAGEADVTVDGDGRITAINMKETGLGYVQPPKISLYGIGKDAEFSINIDTSINSPTFSQIIPPVEVIAQGSGYLSGSTEIEFVGGFANLSASGESAKAEIIRYRLLDGTYRYSINLLDSGLGYTGTPRVALSNAPPGMIASAQINPSTGRVISVQIDEPGIDVVNPYDPLVFFTGGLPYSEVMLNAFAEDPDGHIKEVAFYVNGRLMPERDGISKNPDTSFPYQLVWSPESPGIYEIYATAEDSDGNLVTSPVIRREAVLSQPPVVEFNPRDRAFGFIRPESLDEDGTIVVEDELLALLPEDTLIYEGFGYHSFPKVEFLDSSGLGTGAEGQVILDNGKIVGIKLKKNSSGQILGGFGYSKFKKLTGTIEVQRDSDLIKGINTDFKNEILSGQPILFGRTGESSPDLDLGEYEVEGFQSLKSLLITEPIKFQSGTYELYTFGTEVVIRGGMDTSAQPILLEQGQELSLGMRAIDPEGTSLRPQEGFAVFINGQLDEVESVQISGSGPFYRIIWSPPDIGFYSLRIQATDVDGARGISQTLEVEVKAGMEPQIKMVSPLNENIATSLDQMQAEFAFPSTAVFTFEVKDLDGVIDQVTFYANSLQAGRWPDSNDDLMDANLTAASWREGTTNRYSFSFSPRYAGTYSISASAVDNSGQTNFSQIATVEFVSPYREGSLPPITEIRYPQSPYQLDSSNVIAIPSTKDNPSFTSTSIVPFITKAFDEDGGLDTVNYFADGKWMEAYSAYIQILDAPTEQDMFSLGDGSTNYLFAYSESQEGGTSTVFIPILEKFRWLNELKDALQLMEDGVKLNASQEEDALQNLKKLNVNRITLPAATLLSEILVSIEIAILDEQRNKTLEAINKKIDNLAISAEIIGTNGIYFRHQNPNNVTASTFPQLVSINANAGMVKTKDFSAGLTRFPSRRAEEYHFTQLWTPPHPGVFTIYSIATDNSGNTVMSTPITVRSTLGSTPPEVTITSPASGTQRSVTQVGYAAKGRVIRETASNLWTWWYTGRIAGIEILDPGSGYVYPPDVEFFGSGYGAEFLAIAEEDQTHNRFGQIIGTDRVNMGEGYYGNILVEFRGGLGEEAVFINASASDVDGEIENVKFLVNGRELIEDLTAPYAMQQSLSVGYYEFIAIAKDDSGNMVASSPARLNISTTQGAAPSAIIINPLPPLGEELTAQGQGYFWDFVREYSQELQRSESQLINLQENFDVTANSYIHLVSRATDSDGEVAEVSFYLNNKFLGLAEEIHDSSHYVLPLDLSDFGEQPSYIIETVIKDNSGNLVIPNNPLELNVLPSSGARPEIDIIVPDPSAAITPVYPIGAPIGLAVEAIPDQGSIASVAMYANGRFIDEAEVDENASFGKGAYSLQWTPENPGDYRITASVKDNLGTIIFTKEYVDIQVLDQIGTLPEVELIAPGEDMIVTLGSSIRVTSVASESVGTFDGLQYYVDGEIQYAWTGKLDFNNGLPADGSLLTIDDATGNSVTFEFDADQQISSAGEFQVVSGQIGGENKLQVTGTYNGSTEMKYFIQIDGMKSGRNNSDTFRWSKDGGKTYVDEKLSVLDIFQLGNYGLFAQFSNASEHELGDSWTVLANPVNTIVTIYEEPGSVLRTRNALENAIELARMRDILEIRADAKGTDDELFLYSTFSMPYLLDSNNQYSTVEVSGSAIDDGYLSYNDNDLDEDNDTDNIIRKESAFGQEFYPFGMTLLPQEVGTFSVFAVAKDSTTGSQTVSKSRLITVVDSAGFLPEVTLAPQPQTVIREEGGNSLSLEANAHDPDGKIISVSFYANGMFLEEDVQSPYSASYDINASGHYEVYAVAKDNDGNEVVSNVERVVVDESMDTFGDALQLNFSNEVLWGSVTSLNSVFKAPEGVNGYDNDLTVMVFVNGRFVGHADQYPYTRPMIWEEDPGYSFNYDLEARSMEPYEVEILVVNGGDTYSATQTITVKENPISNDTEFLNYLYKGLFDRSPEGFEISRFLLGLRDGTMTRAQVLEELRCTSEFITARDNLLLHKTLLGEWRTTQIILADQAIPVGSLGGGASNTTDTDPFADEGGGGMAGAERPDDGDNPNTATLIGMNERIDASINNTDDVDWFMIQGNGNGRDGALSVEILQGHTGVEVIGAGVQNSRRLEVFGEGATTPSQYLVPFYARIVQNLGANNRYNSNGRDLGLSYSWDLSSVQINNPIYKFRIILNGVVTEEQLLERGGGYTMIVRNDTFTQVDGEENSLFENVDTEITNYDGRQALGYLTQKYSYTNRYGQIETHNPESFFNRLFYNKYDQEPNLMQTERGIALLKAGDRTQLEFVQQFAQENSIITTGGYNFTTSEAQLAIPNVPIDAVAFAETALVYSALVGKSPSRATVAKLTLDPNFEVRPMVERAKIIMEMPVYTEEYGLAIPEVDFIGISNGEALDHEDKILVEAVSPGPDALMGTSDDGKLIDVELLLNGKSKQTLKSQNGDFFYEFELFHKTVSLTSSNAQISLPADADLSRVEEFLFSDISDTSYKVDDLGNIVENGNPSVDGPGTLSYYEAPMDGEYILEVVAEGTNGLKGRAERRVQIGSGEEKISITQPAHGEILRKDQSAVFSFELPENTATGTTYLEINGNMRWAGFLSIVDNVILDNSMDGVTFTIADGTGREPVSFEFDLDESVSKTVIDPAEEIQINAATTGTLSSGGQYRGQEYREYLVEIDGEDTGITGGDTFKWSIDGGASFNDFEIEIITGQPYTLSSGVTLVFDQDVSNFHIGDRWRIRAYPINEIVEVYSLGTYAQRVRSLKQNLLKSINRARNKGLLSITAVDPLAKDASMHVSGLLPPELSGEQTVFLRHDGNYPISEPINIEVGSTNLVVEELLPLLSSSNGSYVELNHWNKLETCNGLMEVRFVHVSESGHKTYSPRRVFPVVDPGRGYVELISPIGDVFEPSRLPTLYLKEQTDGELDASLIEINDGGKGYRWFEESSKDIKVISRSGTGGVLKGEIDIISKQLSSLSLDRTGQGYQAGDILLPSPPMSFDKGEAIELNARLHDPYSEYEGVAFYINGVEINATTSDRSSGIFGSRFYSLASGDGFISARALYGDSRDFGPVCADPFGSYPCKESYYGGKDHWGWKKSWTQQHYSSGRELLPVWFSQLNNYWQNADTWNRDPMWDGASPVRIGINDVYDSVEVVVDKSSPAARIPELFHEQSTHLDASIIWEKGKKPTITHALLYGNDVLLSEWNASSGMMIQEQNQTNQETESPLEDNQLNMRFQWIVDYRDFKDENGSVDLVVLAISDMGRQFVSDTLRKKIRPLSILDVKSYAPKLYKDLTSENPTEEIVNEIVSRLEDNASLQDAIDDIISFSIQEEIIYLADIIATHKVVFGTDMTPERGSDMDLLYGDFERLKDAFKAGREAALTDYILELFEDDKYYNLYGYFPDLFGNSEGENLRIRDDFASRHFKNKYGNNPSFFQKSQASKKLWFAYNTTGLPAKEAAANYIYNLVTEPSVAIGFGNQVQPYIADTPAKRDLYLGNAKLFALKKLEDQYNTNTNTTTEQNQQATVVENNNSVINEITELEIIEGSAYEAKLKSLAEASYTLQQFNLLWEDSAELENFNDWKHEDWFGYFMDKNFPWIYHSDLGWLYSVSSSQENVWFYSDSIGWFWTNRQTFKDHPNLTSQDQRFIYRVRQNDNGTLEGSWSLVYLNPNNSSSQKVIHLYNYGYYPF